MTIRRRFRLAAAAAAVMTACALPRAVLAQQPATAPTTRAVDTTPIDIPAVINAELNQLRGTLADRNAAQDARDDAAAKLMSRRSPEARKILQDAFAEAGNSGAQLAVARAVTDADSADPELIRPELIRGLGALLTSLSTDSALFQAAAHALVTYKGNPEAPNLLRTAIRQRQLPVGNRIQAIRALGSFEDRQSAELLMRLLTDATELPAIRSEADDALVRFTGLSANARQPERWKTWWNASGNKPPADFRNELVTRRSVELDQVRQRSDKLLKSVTDAYTKQYQNGTAQQKQDWILLWLTDPAAELRILGAKQAYNDQIDTGNLPARVAEQLRKMIGDGDTEVRREVAEALWQMADAPSLVPLLGQLEQEPDAQVRASIIAALTQINDVRAAPSLLKRLNDPSELVQLNVIKALAAMGGSIAKNSALTEDVSKVLGDLYNKTQHTAANNVLREQLIIAMTPLKVQGFFRQIYLPILKQDAELPPMRRLAIKAIAELRTAEGAAIVAGSLSDPEKTVRVEAAKALGNFDAPDIRPHVPQLRDLVLKDQDASVQLAAWDTLNNILGALQPYQLNELARSFNQRPDRQIFIYLDLKRQLTNLGNRPQDLAECEINLGDAMMKAEPPEYSAAALEFGAALVYYKQKNQTVFDSLTLRRMDALLKAKKYSEAITFASESLRDAPLTQRSIIGQIASEARELADSGALVDARTLANEAGRMDPLPEALAAHLVDIDKMIREKQPIRGRGTSGPGANASVPQSSAPPAITSPDKTSASAR